MKKEECVKIFTELGFTELEAQIYLYLVQNSPATGYRIAKEIGRSNANTYKAIETLEAKGTILVDHGVNRHCRAIPPEELFSQLERRFQDRKARASSIISKLKGAPEDDRIYQLSTPDQVYERARQMLRDCEKVALLELYPEPLAMLRNSIEETAKRGVRVSARIYKPDELKGVHLIQSPPEFETLKRSPFQLMTLFVDGKQYLIALFTLGGKSVHQAVWSANPFFSWSYYTFVFSDFLLSSLMPHLEKAESADQIRTEFQKWKRYFDYPDGGDAGLSKLMAKWGLDLDTDQDDA